MKSNLGFALNFLLVSIPLIAFFVAVHHGFDIPKTKKSTPTQHRRGLLFRDGARRPKRSKTQSGNPRTGDLGVFG